VALHFSATRLWRVVSSRPSGRAFRVKRTRDGVRETELDISYLGAEAASGDPPLRAPSAKRALTRLPGAKTIAA